MIETKGTELVVVADNPQELVDSQHALIANISSKIKQTEADLADARDLKRAADMAVIDDTAAKRLIKKEEHRLLYLGKVKDALEAGYVMLPNIRGEHMAIRVQRDRPRQKGQHGQSYKPHASMESPDALPTGEGSYVRPWPNVSHYESSEGKHSMGIDGFEDEIGLPVEFMKPSVVQKVGRAMNLKIFDEIVTISHGPKGDPLVVGIVIEGSTGMKWSNRKRVVSFLIAWFVDTSAI